MEIAVEREYFNRYNKAADFRKWWLDFVVSDRDQLRAFNEVVSRQVLLSEILNLKCIIECITATARISHRAF